MSLPFPQSAGRPLRADGPPVVASPPLGATTGNLIERAADWADGPRDDFFPDRPGRAGQDLALVIGFVVFAVIASALLGVAAGFLAALL